jgi:O-antigen/teichoic acid export membrane protein
MVDIIVYKFLHPGVQKYLKNAGWALAGRVVALAASFLVGLAVARYLGPTNYGTLNYILSIVTIFSFLSSFGIDGILVRDLITYKDKEKEILNTAFTLKLIGGGLVILIVSVFSFFVLKAELGIIGLIILYSTQMIFLSFNVIDSYFQSVVKYKNLFLAQFVSTILVSMLKLVFIYLRLSLEWFVASLLFEVIVSTGIMVALFNRAGGQLKVTVDRKLAKKMLSDSWPFILTSAFFLIYSRIDQVIIGKMLSSKDLGIYAAGVKPAEIWYFLPTLLCSALFPAVVNARINDRRIFIERVKKLFLLVTSLAVIIASIETLFARFIIELLYGSAFIQAAIILQIYTWAGVAISANIVWQQFFTVENKTKIIMLTSLIGAVLNLVLNLILIPHYGIVGSAYATLISYSAVLISYFLIGFKSIYTRYI